MWLIWITQYHAINVWPLQNDIGLLNADVWFWSTDKERIGVNHPAIVREIPHFDVFPVRNSSFTVKDFRLYDETSSSKASSSKGRSLAAHIARTHCCPNVAAPFIFAETK